MRGIEAQAPPDRFCAFGSHAVGSGGRGHNYRLPSSRITKVLSVRKRRRR